MNTPSLPKYADQFNKITEAYIKGELDPFTPEFCFCGNLCDNDKRWFYIERYSHYDFNGYKGEDFVKMESALIGNILKHTKEQRNSGSKFIKMNPKYEDALFKGMVAALEVLKQIHIEKGEVIDDAPVFKKRQLHTV